MAFYKVKQGKSVTIGSTRYESGDLVELTTQQANYHAANIELNDYPVNDQSAIANFTISKGSDFFRTIGLGTKTLEIVSWGLTNPLTLQTEKPHGLITGTKVWIHAYRFTSQGKDVLISNAYLITRLTDDTFSIPLDGSTYALPEFGWVDYLENLSVSTFEGRLYEPKRVEKTITGEATATTQVGSQFVRLSGSKAPSEGLAVGQKITIPNAAVAIPIQSISLENNNQEAILVLASPATATVHDEHWMATFEESDPTQVGVFVGDLAITVNTDLSEISIAYYASDSIVLEHYLYRIFETKNGVTNVILKGALIYE